jgi:hypothetical protein
MSKLFKIGCINPNVVLDINFTRFLNFEMGYLVIRLNKVGVFEKKLKIKK